MSVEMKDSGIAWIGEIPKHWEVTRLKNVFCEYNVKSENGTETLLSLSQYTGVKPKSETELAGSHEAESYEGYKIVKAGQLVMNIMLAWNGSYALSDYDGMISPAYCIYDFRTVCHKKYFHYLLRIDGYPSAFKTMSRGIIDSRLRLYPEQFYTFNTVVPPIVEQSRIANFLDKKCAEIDELIALQEQMIAQLTTYKQSVITETVTKGLDSNVKMKDSGVEWIGEIPEHWDMLMLKNVVSIKRGGSPRPIEEYISDIGYNWIKIGDTTKGSKYIYSCQVKIKESGLSKTRKVQVDDLILTNSMSFGEPYILKIDGCIHDGWVVFSDYKNIDKEFLYYFLLSPFCKQQFDLQVAGGVVQNLNIDKIGTTLLLLPPIKEQSRIATYLDQKCKEIDELIFVKKEKIEKLKAYKKSVIYEYVTGKKQV